VQECPVPSSGLLAYALDRDRELAQKDYLFEGLDPTLRDHTVTTTFSRACPYPRSGEPRLGIEVDMKAWKRKARNMRTTVDLPDDLYRALKARAALSGTTMRELIRRLIEQGLRRSPLLARFGPS
jgi:hypothetical protein